jgi:RimJ/RimL family protein N-acetyltransferase
MNSVFFRDFEEKDIDAIYRWKNDEKLNSMIVGQWHPFSYEDAAKWVHGCMGEHETFKFWAICTNDEKKIIGWTALSKIDRQNQSAYTHSIVIGEKEYQDGFAWIETVLFLFSYSFETLGINRVYGESILGNKASNFVEPLMFMTREGLFRQAVFQNGQFYDISYAAILKDEYFEHKAAGDYEIPAVIRRLKKLRKATI